MSTEHSTHSGASVAKDALPVVLRSAFNEVSVSLPRPRQSHQQTETLETPATGKPSLFVKGQQTLNKTTGVASFALNVATGNYTGAFMSAGQQIALTKGTWEAAAEMTKSVAPVAKGLGQFAKKVPLIGAVVTVGFVVAEAGGDAIHGHYGKAAAATAAGVAETGGNLIGFGVGDGAREVVRGGIIGVAGEKYAPDKSGIRQLVEKGVQVGEKLLDSDTVKQTVASIPRKGKPDLVG